MLFYIVVFFCYFWRMAPVAGVLPILTVGCEWFCENSLWFLGPLIRKTYQTCTGTKKIKRTKPLDAPNLHRHQKSQKKPKPQQLVRKHGHRFGIFSFFGFFGACAGLVIVALWFLWSFWCLSVFCEIKFTKPAQAPKNQKNQTTRYTKPAQAPKKNKKRPKPQQLVRKYGHRFGIFSFFGFFGACAGLVLVALWFLWCFWCLPVFYKAKLTKSAQAPKKPKEPNH